MAKVITGSKSAKKFQVVKGQADTRQIRCKRCGNFAVQVPDGKGDLVYSCVCGAKYAFTQI